MAAVVEFSNPSVRNVRLNPRAQTCDYVESTHEHLTPAIPGARGDRMGRQAGAWGVSGGRSRAGRFAMPPTAVLLAAVALLAGVLFTSQVLSTDGEVVTGRASVSSEMPARSGEYVVVGPGDTFRSVAAEFAPTADQGQLIDAIRALNGGERSLEIGQVLALPLLER